MIETMEIVNCKWEKKSEKNLNRWNFVGRSHGSVSKIYIIHSDKVEHYRRLYVVNATAVQSNSSK